MSAESKEYGARMRQRMDEVGQSVIDQFGEDPTYAVAVISAGVSMLYGHGIPLARALACVCSIAADIEETT